MIDIALDRHLDGTGQRLEDSFYLVMLVLTFGLDVEIHLGRIAQRLEEMQEHFRRHLPYLFTFEVGIPYQPRTASEIQGYLTQAIVHREAIAITFDTSLIAQGFRKTLTQGQSGIFDGVMFIHLQIALHTDGQVEATMLADLLQHVVEEAQAGRNVTLAASVQVYLYIYISFFSGTSYFRHPFTGKKEFSYLVPILGSQSAIFLQSLFYQCALVVLKIDGLTTKVLGQFHIGISVAYHEATRQIVFGIIQVFTQHTGAWLARRCIVFRETTVDEHFIKGDAFVFEGLHYEVMNGPKGLFRERRSTQSILIGHHGKLEIELATDETQVTEYFRIKLQLLVGIKLIIDGRFDDQRTVSIYEQNLFHSTSTFLNASNKASFSSFVPMVMRKQSLHKATLVRLRTMIPSLTK